MTYTRGGPLWTQEEESLLRQYYGTIDAKEISERYLPNRNHKALHQKAWMLGLKSSRKHKLHHTIKIDYFKNITPESAYWGGFLAADGSIIKDPNKPNTYRLCLALSVKDEEHLKLFQKTMGHTGKIGYIHHAERLYKGRVMKAFSSCFVNICQASHMREDLAKLGIIPNKTKRLPPPILDSNVLRLAFLKGYICGDGCISMTVEDRVHIGITSSCKVILDWFKALVDELFPFSYMDRTHSVVTKNKESDSWQYNINGNRALRIISILSKIPTPCLKRKWENARLLEMIEESKIKHPTMWSVHLPIEDEIASFLAKSENSKIPV